MDSFDPILNWKLNVGSHPFPGKDGGTCINEAALVAFGFPYRPISTAHHMPTCFSRPICRLAMQLNDAANDTDRQRLMPFVTRLACADTPKVERERDAVIRSHMREYDYGFLSGTRFEKGLEALEAALAIGREAEPPLFAEVAGRMEAARNAPAALVLKWDRGLSSKLKSWLRASKKAEPVG
jgi:hypothetical protein